MHPSRAGVEWSPGAGLFTLGDLVRHVGAAERYVWAETVHGRPARYVSHGRELADGRDAVLAFLDRMHEEAMPLFRALTPEALAGRIRAPGGVSVSTRKWLMAMLEHEAHHRGQIYTMLGQLGVSTPPLYEMTSEQVRQLAARDEAGGVFEQ